MTEAGASVPNLRAKQPLFRIILVIGVLGLAAGGFVIYKMAKESGDPGGVSCDRIATLAKDEPAKWHDLIEEIIGFVQARTMDSDDPDKRFAVTVQGDDARCRAAFVGISKTITYTRFDKLQSCVQSAADRNDIRACVTKAYATK